jgi:glycine cleavage system H lipoate-binding protein
VLEGSPELLIKKLLEPGWTIKIKPSDPSELKGLMNREAYLGFLKRLKA